MQQYAGFRKNLPKRVLRIHHGLAAQFFLGAGGYRVVRHSVTVGLSFGLTSGIITTLGLLVGLNAGTHSQTAVVGGIVTIAVADAFSDALGIHVSEESENVHTAREIWESTLATFVSKFLFALSFVIPVLLLDLDTAVAVSVAWGFCTLALFSYMIARHQETVPWRVVFEHVLIGVLVVLAAHYTGSIIASTVG
jgi:VIT1/CCC1 family predicted Fe2+/Mn2+ transporter